MQITSDYFYNWAVIREYSLKFGVPSWVFIQSVDFDGSQVGLAQRRRPTEAEILWQINVSLAYGAKGIQYFTYWTPKVEPDGPIQFGEALVSLVHDPATFSAMDRCSWCGEAKARQTRSATSRALSKPSASTTLRLP